MAWCALRLSREPSTAVATLCGILLGLTALVGNAGLAFAAAVAVALAFAPTRVTRKAAYSLLIVGAATLVVSPWVVRNIRALGSPVLNTNGGFNFYLGNNPAATGWYISISETPWGETWKSCAAPERSRRRTPLGREAFQWIREHPLDFAALTMKRAAYFWMPIHEGKTSPSSVERAVRVAWLTQFVAIAAAGLASLAGWACAFGRS